MVKCLQELDHETIVAGHHGIPPGSTIVDVNWIDEIIELHAFFEGWFLGAIDSLDRMESVLAEGFSIVQPDGAEVDRAGTIESVAGGRATSRELVITTSDHRLLHDGGDTLVASYVETHERSDRTKRRLSTVVFVRSDSAPNGLMWVRVHETWLDRE